MNIYHENIPDWLNEFCQTKLLLRLDDVGMHCGCEYTSFPVFKNLDRYTRYKHSINAALIVYHFTSDKVQTLATLFHDVATPVFAHTIDFMHGDYLNQEYTETNTEKMIKEDKEVLALLEKNGIDVNDIVDYHKYPICDNDSPRLSSDRLEYTLSNIVNFKINSIDKVKEYYNNLQVSKIDDGSIELVFKDEELAKEFTLDSLKSCQIYVCDEDRYSMQILSELMKKAVSKNVISLNDLYITETEVISKLMSDEETKIDWLKFRSLSQIVKDDSVKEIDKRIVKAKKRYINPFVLNKKRVTELDKNIEKEITDYLNSKQDYWISAV